MRFRQIRSIGSGLLMAAALALAVTGCPKDKAAEPGPESGGGGGPVGKNYKIAVIPKGTAASFWLTVKAGADQAGKEENVEVVWQGTSNENDIPGQIDYVQTAVTNKVDGIVLAAQDKEALVKPAKAAISKGIPVVTIDSGLAKDKDPSVCYVATDNVEGGRKGADALAREIGEKGKVGLLVFHKGAVSSDQREQGFLEGIKKYPNIKLVSTLESNDPTLANNMTTNMLTANPDIVGIFAANEPNGVGAASVIKQKGLAGKVKLVAFDSSNEEVQALKDGIIQALVVQDPFQMGYQGVKTVLKALRKQPIHEKFVNSGVTVVTKDNLSTPAVQKLVNPTGAK